MSRLDRAWVVVVALLVVGLAIAVAGASLAGLALLLAGVVLLAVLVPFSEAKARRSPGWTRAWNPGAAHREAEAKAERDAIRQRALEDAASEPDEPGS